MRPAITFFNIQLSNSREKATEKTSEKFILNMYKKGYTLDQIADIAETSVEVVDAIIKKKIFDISTDAC
mgnify:CR=1 FL=1